MINSTLKCYWKFSLAFNRLKSFIFHYARNVDIFISSAFISEFNEINYLWFSRSIILKIKTQNYFSMIYKKIVIIGLMKTAFWKSLLPKFASLLVKEVPYCLVVSIGINQDKDIEYWLAICALVPVYDDGNISENDGCQLDNTEVGCPSLEILEVKKNSLKNTSW